MPSVIRKNNQNIFEFVFLEGQLVDQQIQLNNPCKRITVVRQGVSIGPPPSDFFNVLLISFQKLNFQAPVPLSQIDGKQGFPLYSSRFEGGKIGDDENPYIEFRCPFTDFFVNFWAIALDGSIQNGCAQLIASDKDITRYKTFSAANLP